MTPYYSHCRFSQEQEQEQQQEADAICWHSYSLLCMKNSIIQGNVINKHQFKAKEKEEPQKFLLMWKRVPAAAMDSPALHSLNSGMVRVKLFCLMVQDRLDIHLFLKSLP